MKKLVILLTAVLISTAVSFPSFAGEWKQDETGWWYDNGDSSFAKDGWHWIDGKCYYFTSDGYCLINTASPDGYTVDESGAWIIDGVVQTQETSVQTYTLGDLTIKVPENFKLSEISDTDISFESLKYMTVISFHTAEYEYLPEDFNESDILSLPNGTAMQINNTTWNRYYLDPPEGSHASRQIFYFRCNNNSTYMCLIFVGYNGDPIDPDLLIYEIVN